MGRACMLERRDQRQCRQPHVAGVDLAIDMNAVAVDKDNALLISGTGDVIEPDEGVLGIGSGGAFAQAAALALIKHTELDAAEIAREAINIAQGICVYTGGEIMIEEL